MRYLAVVFLCLLFVTANSYATIFGTVRGLVHDPQHRPVSGASVTIRAENLDWHRSTTTNASGEFRFDAVPVGYYVVSAAYPGFVVPEQRVVLNSGATVDLHFPLSLAQVNEQVEVSAQPEVVDTESSSTPVNVTRNQIAQTPGASRTNSLAMITDYVPGAVMVHDQLHVRGGHQVTWLLDGVPVPNTNIASNVGPQFDPKDVDEIEVQRGGYSAEYGDRAYGVFNVVPRSGFERKNEGTLILNYGNFNTTDDQITIGSHTQRFAYYASVNGNRTDLGLMAPTLDALHDSANGFGGFLSLIFNLTPSDQLRLVSSNRSDHYQVPNDAEQQLSGTRDVEDERDSFLNFSWVHSAGHKLFTISPFYHFNRAHYIGGPGDVPVRPEDDRGSNYAGGVATAAWVEGKHNARVGVQGFVQRDNELFGISATDPALDPSLATFRERRLQWGAVNSAFLEEQYRATPWLTLNAGLRVTHFSGLLNEHAVDPRLGAAFRLPRLGVVLRGFYGRYYQAPPLITVSGPLLEVAAQQGFGFLPLHGERDEQHEFGLTIPLKNWNLDADYFHTGARNFFDHDALGNSNIFFPLTFERARIRGWEASLRSPRLASRAQLHIAYSHQFVEGRGGVTGGLTDFAPPESSDLFFLDHDQRDTLSVGGQVALPWQAWANANIAYGSGFLNGDGPSHLPSHTTADLSLGKSIGERWSVQATALNLTNHRYLLDNSNTFGGTHFAFPRQVSVQLQYKFKY